MPRQIFSSFWHGPALSPLHWACLDSFPRNGHTLRLFVYDEVAVPKGVVLEDASRILPLETLFAFQNTFSAFSNIFRYTLLLKHGGFWVDTDVYCLTEDIPSSRYVWAHEDPTSIAIGVLKFPRGDRVLRAILEEALEIGPAVKVWGEIGPRLFTRHIEGRTFKDHYGSTEAFYPIHWLETALLWIPQGDRAVRSRCARSPLVHLWGSMFRRLGIDLDRQAPPGSFLEAIYRQAGFERPLPPQGLEDTARALAAISNFLGRERGSRQAMAKRVQAAFRLAFSLEESGATRASTPRRARATKKAG